MLVIKTKKELRFHLESLNTRQSLGLVPTMGALHEGHTSLVEKALTENDYVAVSIFVNPTQFNNNEDLAKYPKTLEADFALLKNISSKLIVFTPSVAEIYPERIAPKTYDFHGLDKVMEGAYRDDHFNGVGTIVEMLLRLIEPDRAYFGEKDFQQLQIIRKLVELEQLPVEIKGCPIVREANGLAMSSRNERLSKDLRMEASLIYSTLQTAKKKFGTKSAKNITDWVVQEFQDQPNFELEYFEISDVETLTPIQKIQQHLKYRAFVAVYADGIRLIDNIALN
ncbi:pantoate--beta-alanine ligase [uncultured Kriegella sp.]|uniref:pantoate--beta-alanine ligase n=1 Tax=uncultured Kriegella sp. TaxID=1798910 RepID=UPI0030DB2AE2